MMGLVPRDGVHQTLPLAVEIHVRDHRRPEVQDEMTQGEETRDIMKVGDLTMTGIGYPPEIMTTMNDLLTDERRAGILAVLWSLCEIIQN